MPVSRHGRVARAPLYGTSPEVRPHKRGLQANAREAVPAAELLALAAVVQRAVAAAEANEPGAAAALLAPVAHTCHARPGLFRALFDGRDGRGGAAPPLLRLARAQVPTALLPLLRVAPAGLYVGLRLEICRLDGPCTHSVVCGPRLAEAAPPDLLSLAMADHAGDTAGTADWPCEFFVGRLHRRADAIEGAGTFWLPAASQALAADDCQGLAARLAAGWPCLSFGGTLRLTAEGAWQRRGVLRGPQSSLFTGTVERHDDGYRPLAGTLVAAGGDEFALQLRRAASSDSSAGTAGAGAAAAAAGAGADVAPSPPTTPRRPAPPASPPAGPARTAAPSTPVAAAEMSVSPRGGTPGRTPARRAAPPLASPGAGDAHAPPSPATACALTARLSHLEGDNAALRRHVAQLEASLLVVLRHLVALPRPAPRPPVAPPAGPPAG